MDEGGSQSAALERDVEAYARQLAGFGAFTLRCWVFPDQPGELILEADVYHSGVPEEVEELRQLLSARPLGAHCMCMGSATISLESGPAPVVLSIHHGQSVRPHDASSNNFELARGRELAEWLAARGLPGIRNEMDESERRAAQFEAEEMSWVAAMPASVVPYREAMLNLGPEAMLKLGRKNVDPSDPTSELVGLLSQAIRNAEADDGGRIRSLLRWQAGGSGRCSGYPVHEYLPETLLLAEAPDALFAVVSAHDLTAAELAGAARLVAQTWHVSEFDRLPDAAWDRLTAAAADGETRDRLARLRASTRQTPGSDAAGPHLPS